jgi:hypothetical protein
VNSRVIKVNGARTASIIEPPTLQCSEASSVTNDLKIRLFFADLLQRGIKKGTTSLDGAKASCRLRTDRRRNGRLIGCEATILICSGTSEALLKLIGTEFTALGRKLELEKSSSNRLRFPSIISSDSIAIVAINS